MVHRCLALGVQAAAQRLEAQERSAQASCSAGSRRHAAHLALLEGGHLIEVSQAGSMVEPLRLRQPQKHAHDEETRGVNGSGSQQMLLQGVRVRAGPEPEATLPLHLTLHGAGSESMRAKKV